MGEAKRIWLINNAESGSNTAETLEECVSHCADCGFELAHRTQFPAQDMPTPGMLDEAGISLAVIFAGDGTVNAGLQALSGWSGSVMILPGGTMNLLYHRLCGEEKWQEVVAKAARGELQRHRPAVIQTPEGIAYAGLLAGPGTAWGDVREAMRSRDPVDFAAETRDAFRQTLSAPGVVCTDPAIGKRDGYPLILLTPQDGEILVDAYHAESGGEYLEQFVALVRRDFREGPHDRLGEVPSMSLSIAESSTFGVLVDGERYDVHSPSRFELVQCPVELLATRTDG